MKLPPVKILNEHKNIVSFETLDRSFSGTAYKDVGCNESQYDIVSVELVDTSTPLIESIPNKTATLNVIGPVTSIWEDGVFVIEVSDFDFWVSPEEYDGLVKQGQYFRLLVSNFTLYL